MKYMGQIQAECDCPTPGRCTERCEADATVKKASFLNRLANRFREQAIWLDQNEWPVVADVTKSSAAGRMAAIRLLWRKRTLRRRGVHNA